MEEGEMKNNGGEVNGLYENLREWVKEKWVIYPLKGWGIRLKIENMILKFFFE